MKTWQKILLGVAIAGVALFTLFGMAIQLGFLPDTKVLRRGEINDRITSAIGEQVELNPREVVQFFYSSGFLSYAEDGSVITNQRIISWGEDESGELSTWEASWEEIVDCVVEEKGSFLEDMIVRIETILSYDIYILLSTEDDRHEEALAYIRKRIGEREEE
jgi:hypothetical protein